MRTLKMSNIPINLKIFSNKLVTTVMVGDASMGLAIVT